MIQTMSIPTLAQAAATPPTSAWMEVFGRAHAMLVHFPIALLLAGLAFEALFVLSGHARRGREALSDQYRNRPPILSPAAAACVILAGVISPVAAWSGWTNASSQTPDDALQLHRWLGVATAIGAGLTGLCALVALTFRSWAAATASRVVLVLSAIVVIPTGHLGGELVFGEGYLLAPLNRPATLDGPPPVVPRPPTSVAPVDFSVTIRPILEARCVECHGSRRQRARLRLDSLDAILGNPRASILSRGRPEESELLRRVSLPADDPDRMPPNGDRLSVQQVAAIASWLEALDAASDGQGANDPLSQPTSDGGPDSVTPERPPGTPAPSPEPSFEGVLEDIRARGGFAAPIAYDSPFIEVNLSVAGRAITDADLALLTGLEESLVWLNLSGTSVTDGGVAALSEFRQLTRLNVSRTAIGDDAITAIAALPKIEVLNVYETRVSDAGLRTAAAMPALRRVYVWQSAVTQEGADQIRSEHPLLVIDTGGSLPPPG